MHTMTLSATGTLLAERPALAVGSSTCGCGQELDYCHAGHCPRCGTTLKH